MALPVSNVGFFESLFDMSFTAFITTNIVKALYALTILILGVIWLAWVIYGFIISPLAGVLILFAGGLISLFGVIVVRLYLEALIVHFRMAEDTAELAIQERRKRSAGGVYQRGVGQPGGSISDTGGIQAPAPSSPQRPNIGPTPKQTGTEETTQDSETCLSCNAPIYYRAAHCSSCGVRIERGS